MDGLIEQALGFVGAILWQAFNAVVGLFLPFLPDADSGIVSSISGWGEAMSGFQTTFNFFYFLDFGAVSAFFAATLLVVTAYIVYRVVVGVVGLVSKLVEMIPVVE